MTFITIEKKSEQVYLWFQNATLKNENQTEERKILKDMTAEKKLTISAR